VWLPETDVPLNDPWKVSWLVARRRRRRADAALRRHRARVRSASRSVAAAALCTLVAVAAGNVTGGSSASGDTRSGAPEPAGRQAGGTVQRGLPSSGSAGFGGFANPHPATLQRIAECESGGDPGAIGGGGLHRGKYQFTFETWYDMGGRGDPALAPESEQDRRAAQLLRERGTVPWPNCA
jgi:hypothetical protein